jgi:RHS repeat-associated protein
MKLMISRTDYFNASRRLLCCVLLSLVFAISANAQSPTGGTTPLALSPGAPSGSYSLSGFETVNPYNGNLNFHLPLISVGGRGGASMVSMLELDTKSWTVKHTEVTNPITGLPEDVYTPTPNWWSPKPGYGPGKLVGRLSGSNATQTCGTTRNIYQQTLTRLTFTAADGTEYELRDAATGGQPATVSNPCAAGASRGTTFITADGTAATFLSDATISDDPVSGHASLFYPSGYFLLRDGTRYRIDGGNVTWIRDRNGNKLSFAYTYDRVTTITDSLNRTVAISYADMVSTYDDQITYKGYGGATRTILITHTSLSSALRSGFTIKSYQGLFPELNNASSGTQFNPIVVSAVTLPNGQQYQLRYNSDGELARVELPTGGVLEYDYTSTSGAITDGTDYHIYRRVKERRVYADGVNLEGKTTYSEPTGDVVTVDHLNPSGTLLAREKHYFQGNAGNLMFGTTGISYPAKLDGREYKTELFHTDGTTVLKRIENTWANRAVVSWWYSPGDASEPPNDTRLVESKTTLEPATLNLVSKQSFGYDDSVPFNNQNNVKEYDFGTGAPGALSRETRTTYITSGTYTGTTVHLRDLPSDVSVWDGAGVRRAFTVNEFDVYSGANHAALVDRTAISGFDSSFGTSYTTRGNITAVARHLLNDSGVSTSSIPTYSQYDIAGNLVKTIDGRGHATTIEYADRFGAPDADARANSNPSELGAVSQSSYAFATLVTNTLNHTAYTQFDYYLGKPVDAEDPNSVTYSGYYDDVLDRPTKLISASNQSTSIKTQTIFSYDDLNRKITTTSDLNSFNDSNPLKSQLLYDQMGRTIEARKFENATDYITTKTEYDALGRAYRTSNPYRSGESVIWTTSAFDGLSRIVSMTTPDSAVVGTAYSGNRVLVTDQIGKQRISKTNALGQLTDVWEVKTSDGDTEAISFPGHAEVTAGYRTSYGYDTLDDLVAVTQGGQHRYFKYDSMKRLLRAYNPEQDSNSALSWTDPITGNSQWTMGYNYDNNGNLSTRIDARNITSTYAYDALNRNTTITYSDGTPDVLRVYDGAANGKGRPYATYTGTSPTNKLLVTAIDGYDALGRPSYQRQHFWLGSAYDSGYYVYRTYDRVGNVKTQTYPSGVAVTYNYDRAGRLADDGTNLAFTGNLGDGVTRNYSQGITYTPLGGMAQEQYGTDTAVYNKLFYNSRGQLAEIRESTTPNDTSWNRGAIINHYSACWGMCGGYNSTTSMTDNNGNLKKQEVYIPDSAAGEWPAVVYTSFFTYDALNRLQSADGVRWASGPNTLSDYWKQTNIYDRYGNRRIDTNTSNTYGAGVNNKDFTVNTANNRLGVPGGQSGAMSYDAAGNLTSDTYTGAGNRTYDAENCIVQAWGGTGQWQYYSYSADGHRIKRKVDGVETWQVYGLDGELVSEYAAAGATSAPQKEYGYRNGQLLVTAAVGSKLNVASATASNTAGPGNEPSKAIDNSTSSFWSSGGPAQQWIELDLGTTYTISKIRLLVNQLPNGATTHQIYGGPTTGSLSLLGTLSGTTQNGQWLQFDTATTNVRYVRVTTTSSPSWVAWSEIEVYGTEVNWLVSDQLGTPRMIFDKSGSLTRMKRHDYLPFGEEISSFGGRTAGQGYNLPDSIRQQFTSKERDIETGLDYFDARYHGSMQGRFTSVDPMGTNLSRQIDPQQLNRYSYVRNNPLKYTDRDGRDLKLAPGLKKADQDRILKRAVNLYRKATGRAAIERMERSDIKFEVGTGKLPSQTNLLEGTISQKYGETKAVGFSGAVDPNNRGKVTAIDRTSGTVQITLDFAKRDNSQTAYENGQSSKAPPSEQHVFDHELGHGNDMNNDMVREVTQSEQDAEKNAEAFANTSESEKDSMSKEDAEKRVREIFGIPPKPEKEKKKNE